MNANPSAVAASGHRSTPGLVLVSAGATLLAVAALFHIERRSPDVDPQYARDIVERTVRFGGSYYENGIHNKGPLEPAVHHLTHLLTTYHSYWFGMAVFVIAAGAVAGLVARRVVTLLDGPEWLGWTAFGAMTIHLTLSGADYAGVLYSRHMTVTLLGVAFLVCTTPGALSVPGHGRLVRLVVAGACLGLAVQTLVTAALTVVVVAGAVIVGLPAGRSVARGPSDRWWFVGAMVVTFVSAPVYYALFGPWRAFWDGWWVYGTYMSAATGRSLFEQLGLGWHEWYGYAVTHAPATIAAAGFVLLGVARWDALSRRARRLHLLLPCWWVAAWFEIILTQRYSSHYFVVTTLPLALMVVGSAWHLVDLVERTGGRIPAPSAIGGGLVVASLLWSGTAPMVDGLAAASSFTGVDAVAYDRAVARDGTSRSVQAVLDLVSAPGDPMAAWTNHPWPYLDYHRVSATRYIWKSFLTGEIYLGRTSTDYIVPGSWDHWTADMAVANPAAFLLDAAVPVPTNTPVASVLASSFQPAFTAPTASVSLRRDVYEQFVARSGSLPWLGDGPVDGWSRDGWSRDGWSMDDGSITFDAADGDPSVQRLPLGDRSCSRWDATVAAGAGISFHFDEQSGVAEHVEMLVERSAAGTVAVSRSPNVEFLRMPVEATAGSDEITLSLVVGTASAVLLVDDRIVAALTLLEGTEVSASSMGDDLVLHDVTVGPAPALGECAD